MSIKVSSDIAIGNALLESNDKDISVEQLIGYMNEANRLLSKSEYYVYIESESIYHFCNSYPFLVKQTNNGIEIIDKDTEVQRKRLDRYFRIGVPEAVVKSFKDASHFLNNQIPIAEIQEKEKIYMIQKYAF